MTVSCRHSCSVHEWFADLVQRELLFNPSWSRMPWLVLEREKRYENNECVDTWVFVHDNGGRLINRTGRICNGRGHPKRSAS